MILHINPLIAAGVLASTAATDATYVMFSAAVAARKRVPAASWSAFWYLLLGLRGDQLHAQCLLRAVRRGRLLGGRIRLAHLAPGALAHSQGQGALPLGTPLGP